MTLPPPKEPALQPTPPRKTQPRKKTQPGAKRHRKIDPQTVAIITAIIGLVGTIVTVIFTSPVIITWIQQKTAPPATVTTAAPSETPSPAPALATETALPILAAAATETLPPPSATPIPATDTPAASPTPASALPAWGSCISADVWVSYKGYSLPTNKNGCWQLDKYGMIAQNDLAFFLPDVPGKAFYGLYAPFASASRVRFSIQIDELTTLNDEDGNIAVAIIPLDTPVPLPTRGTQLLFQVETSAPHPSFVRLKTQERNQPEKYIPNLPQYEFGRRYEFEFQLAATTMTIYQDGQQITAQPLGLPIAPRALWIGYTLPQGGSLTAAISGVYVR
jgi:hypothetical protein